METLSEAIKTTRQDKNYILYLIKKKRIEFAYDAVNDVYIVNTDDVIYHVEQTKLRRLGTKAINRVKHERIMRRANVPESVISYARAKAVVPLAKSVKLYKTGV